MFDGEPLSKSNKTLFTTKRKTNTPFAYYKKSIIDYEKNLRQAAIEQIALLPESKRKRLPLYGPVRLSVKYYLSTRRVKDLPNLPKTTCDALNDVAYIDDHLICEMITTKLLDAENPRVEITVEAIDGLGKDSGLFPIKYKTKEESKPRPTKTFTKPKRKRRRRRRAKTTG